MCRDSKSISWGLGIHCPKRDSPQHPTCRIERLIPTAPMPPPHCVQRLPGHQQAVVVSLRCLWKLCRRNILIQVTHKLHHSFDFCHPTYKLGMRPSPCCLFTARICACIGVSSPSTPLLPAKGANAHPTKPACLQSFDNKHLLAVHTCESKSVSAKR